MIKYYWFVFLVFTYFTTHAQYTNVINTNRPGFTESPYSVGSGIIQLESGLTYQYSKNNHLKNEFDNVLALENLRFSLFSERLEFIISGAQNYYQVKNEFDNTIDENVGGFSLGGGAKFLIHQPTYKDKKKEIRSWNKRYAFDWSRLVPAIGISVAGNYQFNSDVKKFDTKYTPNTRYETIFRGALLLQNNLSDYWVVTNNIAFETALDKTNNVSLTTTSSYTASDNWVIFLEGKTYFSPINYAEGRFGLGYMINPNLQLDSSMNLGFLPNTTFMGFTMGVSYRIDRHEDSYFEVPLDSVGNKLMPPSRPHFVKRTGIAIGKATVSTGKFFKKAGEKTKEYAIVGAITTGEFFSNLFTKKSKIQNDSTAIDEVDFSKTKRIKKPKKGKQLAKEIEQYNDPNYIPKVKDTTEKKGFFKRLFSKKEKNNDEVEQENVPTINENTSTENETVAPEKKQSWFSRLFSKKKKEETEIETENFSDTNVEKQKTATENEESIPDENTSEKKKSFFSKLFSKNKKTIELESTDNPSDAEATENSENNNQ